LHYAQASSRVRSTGDRASYVSAGCRAAHRDARLPECPKRRLGVFPTTLNRRALPESPAVATAAHAHGGPLLASSSASARRDAIMAASNGPSTSTMLKVLGCVTGVVGALLVYGILQERIMTRPYGEGADAERFTFSVFLVMNNRCVSMIVAAVVLALKRGLVSPVAPIYSYAAVSASNVVATTCQYEALKYVSFPVQTLGKCAKMIPVMIWGYAINGKTYKIADYLVACGVMTGCTLFAMYGETKSSSAEGPSTGIYGIALMLGYLGFDGFTSTFQDKLFKGYQMETYNQMLWVNFCSAVISSFWLFSDSSMGAAIQFIQNHPEALNDVLILSAASTCGQLCILYTIREFGALLFATIMTTRQFLSILLSCVIFMHPLTALQWLGTAMVFASLYYQAFMKNAAKKDSEGKEEALPTQAPEDGKAA
jgi:adenosine 3'-phospho 5'-phosphosulfate transporter B2